MQQLIVIAVVGLLAQLVDGSLGMGYGVTSSTLLLTLGVSPVTSSASIHLAKVGTTLASAASHARMGNVQWGTVNRIALPGAFGGFFGALALTRVPADTVEPVIASFLFALGVVILVRFSRAPRPGPRAVEPHRLTSLAPLGLVAGFCDAVGGGGWGPISTSSLLAAGRMTPRSVIGSVNTSEFLVAIAVTGGFVIGIGTGAFALPIVAALLGGGLVAAPVAAWVVQRLPAHLLGVLVGGMILLTNIYTVADAFDLPGAAVTVLAGATIIAVLGALVRARTERLRAATAVVQDRAPAEA